MILLDKDLGLPYPLECMAGLLCETSSLSVKFSVLDDKNMGGAYESRKVILVCDTTPPTEQLLNSVVSKTFGILGCANGFPQDLLSQDWEGPKLLVRDIRFFAKGKDDFEYLKYLDEQSAKSGVAVGDPFLDDLCVKLPGDGGGEYVVFYWARVYDEYKLSQILRSNWVHTKNAFLRAKLMELSLGCFVNSEALFHRVLEEYVRFLIEVWIRATKPLEEK